MRGILVGILILLICGTIWLGFEQQQPMEPTATSSVEKDTPSAPNFKLKRLNGKQESLYKVGKPTLINFWTSWCGPCQVEMPLLQKAYEKYKDQLDFQMINVTVDDDREQVKQFIQKKGYTFPVLLDETGEASEIYQLHSLPTTFFIDSKGKVHKQVLGAMTEQQLENLIKSLLINPQRKE